MLVATGSALAPYLSMIRSTQAEAHDTQFVVVHAAAVSWDLVFRAQLEELAEHSRHVTYLPTITAPERDPSWHGLTGDVEALLRQGEIEDATGLPVTPEHFDVFLAGHPAMIEAVSAELIERGFSAGPPDHPDTNIHVERYW
jgi:ferredoxin--NADP+ reductase